MARKLLWWLHAILAGPGLVRAIERNNEAADRLDATVREVLKQ